MKKYLKDLDKANYHAKMSCVKWNKWRLSRRFHRYMYRKMADDYFWSHEHQHKVAIYRSGQNYINTYVWPYSDLDFARWPEDDHPESYTLISDPSGCVIRYATSYCAYKIFELTGEWPQKKTKERLDANRWVQFLAEAGYTKQTPYSLLVNGKNYVGIDPDQGIWGAVVWFESIYRGTNTVKYSTYYNWKYRFVKSGNPKDFIWIEIEKSRA